MAQRIASFPDVDTQVQYLSVDKISITALLFIPGFLWVGTSAGLILLYPLPKLQGVPRVIGRACVAFHGHCGPVRSLLAIPQGEVSVDTTNDDVSTGGKLTYDFGCLRSLSCFDINSTRFLF